MDLEGEGQGKFGVGRKKHVTIELLLFYSFKFYVPLEHCISLTGLGCLAGLVPDRGLLLHPRTPPSSTR